MDIRSIHSCIKYFETTLGKAPRMVKEDDEDIYCGPVLTDFAKELVDKVEKRKKDADKVLTQKNTSVKKKNR
tara:strand:- start:457 stop:672 length:216 start_codon:yes stop_codon:yes gene_type:complete